MTPVVWKSYKKDIINRGYWDQAILEDMFSGELWKPQDMYSFSHHDDFDNEVKACRGAVVVIPARHHADKVTEINNDIAALEWCLLILTGDEEQAFPIEQIKHKNIRIWAMTPHMGKTQAHRFIVNGYAPGTRQVLRKYKYEYLNKDLRASFIGQVTHKRRKDCAQAMITLPDTELITTRGFTQGVSQDQYLKSLARAEVAPCPSGAVIPDTFRLYEALEAGCVPLADNVDPNGGSQGYFNYLFGIDTPIPIINDWLSELEGNVNYFNDVKPIRNNLVYAFWQAHKRRMVYWLKEDIAYLCNETEVMYEQGHDLTVLIPTSPSIVHPDTSMIEETIKSIRDRLPKSEIIIMIDGVREEQLKISAAYQEYIKRLLWLCNFEYTNVLPVIFEEHTHQVGMTRECLKLVKTPAIMFVEHDTPLCEHIPFYELIKTVRDGEANMIRLHHEALILPDHKHLMLDSEPQLINSIPLLRTAQWSQRPHIANTNFYKNILEQNFSAGAKTMIEDGIHGKVHEAFTRRGLAGWLDWKVWIYAPSGDMKRSYHTDGRKNEPKYDESFIY